MLPYAASEVSSAASGWRQHYWQQPSVNFTRGLLSQDISVTTATSHCKCVVSETKYPPLPKLSPAEIHNEHRIKWLGDMVAQEKKALKRQQRSMSEVNANMFTTKQLDHHPWSHQWLPAKAINAAKKAEAAKQMHRAAAAVM